MTIGVLPDVLEDTNITASELRELGFSEQVILGLEWVTKLESEEGDLPDAYARSIVRCSKNQIFKG